MKLKAFLLTMAALLLLASVALAQGGYDLSWWTVDGGGGTSSGGNDGTDLAPNDDSKLYKHSLIPSR